MHTNNEIDRYHTTIATSHIIGSGTGLSPGGTHKDADLCIGAGPPPRLVTRIEAGEFLDMAELLPDHRGPATTEPLPKPSKRCHDVSNILEWIRCFSAYVEVMIPPCGTLPSRTRPDLCATSSASVSRIPQQNVSGHLTKGPISQELSPSIKLSAQPVTASSRRRRICMLYNQ